MGDCRVKVSALALLKMVMHARSGGRIEVRLTLYIKGCSVHAAGLSLSHGPGCSSLERQFVAFSWL